MGQATPITASSEAHRPGQHTLEGEARVVFTLLGLVSDIVLDLDMPVTRARDLFTLALYRKAESRYRTSTRVSLAFDTALRTVKKIKKRFRDGGVEQGEGPHFNLRRKVYFMLLDREMDLDEIARELPINYEVNYARLSVETLLEQGLCEELDRGRGHVTYRALIPEGYVNFFREDHEAAVAGFERFLSAMRKVVRERLLRGNSQTALARGFVARVRQEDAEEFADDLRAAVVRLLMEYESRADGLGDEQLMDMELLIGLAPSE
jgi:predicted DNA-binding transcriptional regulator